MKQRMWWRLTMVAAMAMAGYVAFGDADFVVPLEAPIVRTATLDSVVIDAVEVRPGLDVIFIAGRVGKDPVLVKLTGAEYEAMIGMVNVEALVAAIKPKLQAAAAAL